MKIKEILSYFYIESDDAREIVDLAIDSRECGPSTCFIALKGETTDGSDYIPGVIRRSVPLILSETKCEGAIHIPDIKKLLTPFAIWFYQVPLDKLKLIGVTGTNGKSTISYLVHQALNLLDKRALLISTTEGIKDSIRTINTTPNGLELAKIFLFASKNGYDHIIMECSSIGIALHKLEGLTFEVGVLSNLYTDHLDFHRSVKNYHLTKLNFLRTNCHRLVSSSSLKVRRYLLQKDSVKVNLVDKKLIKNIAQDENLSFEYDGMAFVSQLLGRYNALNIVLAYETLKSLGFVREEIIEVFKNIKPLLGRYEVVSKNPLVIIDYAHTSKAFKTLVKDVASNYPHQKIVLVFGSGGERDIRKRKIYGKVALRYGYLSIVTSDNNRGEKFIDIARMIIGKHKNKFLVIKDRKMAIKWGCSILDSNHMLLLVGKGPEKSELENGKVRELDEREEVKRWLYKS